MIEQIEADMVDEYLMAPIGEYAFASYFREQMLHPWQSPYGATVKLADHISALLEADLERSHSVAFSDAYDHIREKIEEYQDPRINAILGSL
jgi:HD containing hydrolase-like enzyme